MLVTPIAFCTIPVHKIVNMASYLSREQYLKRYLSADDDKVKAKKKRKKVKTPVVQPKVRIVDDDVDFDSLLPSNLKNTLEDDVGDNDPTIADFVDERPDNVKQLEQFRQDDKWKIIGKDKESTSVSTNRSRHDSSSDNSPVRERHDSDSNDDHKAAPKQRHDSDSDSDRSPVRKSREDSDASPPRKSRHDSSSDASSSKRKHNDLHKSSQETKRHDSDSDVSPTRRGAKSQRDSDVSPPRKNRQSDSDASPPRSRKKQSVNRHDSDSDQSPARKGKSQVDSDASPPRKNRNSDSDALPPRRRNEQHTSNNSKNRQSRQSSDSDISVERKGKRGSDSDASPPRRQKRKSDLEQSSGKKHKKTDKELGRDNSLKRKRSRWNSPESDKHQTKLKGSKDKVEDKPTEKDDRGRSKNTLSGLTAGLSSAQQMMEEARKLKEREDKLFKQMDSDLLGKDAKTVHRAKGGGRRNLQEEQEKEAEEEAKKAVKAAQYKKWGKGLKQQEEQDTNIQDALHQMGKTLTRHKDDEDMNDMLKQQERIGDPMLAFLKKKKIKGNKKDVPRYKGPEPPPNRFKIWPGYRWDGVDRSTGFEKKLFAKANDRKAVSEIAHKWSTEDM